MLFFIFLLQNFVTMLQYFNLLCISILKLLRQTNYNTDKFCNIYDTYFIKIFLADLQRFKLYIKKYCIFLKKSL